MELKHFMKRHLVKKKLLLVLKIAKKHVLKNLRSFLNEIFK